MHYKIIKKGNEIFVTECTSLPAALAEGALMLFILVYAYKIFM